MLRPVWRSSDTWTLKCCWVQYISSLEENKILKSPMSCQTLVLGHAHYITACNSAENKHPTMLGRQVHMAFCGQRPKLINSQRPGALWWQNQLDLADPRHGLITELPTRQDSASCKIHKECFQTWALCELVNINRGWLMLIRLNRLTILRSCQTTETSSLCGATEAISVSESLFSDSKTGSWSKNEPLLPLDCGECGLPSLSYFSLTWLSMLCKLLGLGLFLAMAHHSVTDNWRLETLYVYVLEVFDPQFLTLPKHWMCSLECLAVAWENSFFPPCADKFLPEKSVCNSWMGWKTNPQCLSGRVVVSRRSAIEGRWGKVELGCTKRVVCSTA